MDPIETVPTVQFAGQVMSGLIDDYLSHTGRSGWRVSSAEVLDDLTFEQDPPEVESGVTMIRLNNETAFYTPLPGTVRYFYVDGEWTTLREDSDGDSSSLDRLFRITIRPNSESVDLEGDVSHPDTSQPYFLDLIRKIDEITA